ncbi:hypothetical protein ACLOJK_014263 [Asimina triloba]
MGLRLCYNRRLRFCRLPLVPWNAGKMGFGLPDLDWGGRWLTADDVVAMEEDDPATAAWEDDDLVATVVITAGRR